MLKYLPFVVVGIAMVPLTVYQWSLLDWVWGANTPAMQCAYLLETQIPYQIGDWVGEDRPVDPKVLEVAGADGYIDRVYTNTKTDQKVSIWLIVGHFRQVSRHTPNFCYKAAGFKQVEKATLFAFDIPDLPTSKFRTAKFLNQDGSQDYYQRVFWAWWKPNPLEPGQTTEDVNIAWSSPEDPRIDFGYCRALYKLYFTSITTPDETPGESVCLEFASEFLPLVHDRLRESGIVMVNDELPADAEQVLKRMKESNEKGGTADDTEPSESDDANETAAQV